MSVVYFFRVTSTVAICDLSVTGVPLRIPAMVVTSMLVKGECSPAKMAAHNVLRCRNFFGALPPFRRARSLSRGARVNSLAGSANNISSFDPALIARGINYERSKGFINAPGRTDGNFQKFLVPHLQLFSSEITGSLFQKEVDGLLLEAKRYDAMSSTQRHDFCSVVEKFLNWYHQHNSATELSEQGPAIFCMDGAEAVHERPSQPVIKWTRPCMEICPGYAFIGIDFETNGHSITERDQVVEIGAMNYSSGSIFHSLINPGNVVWNKKAEEVHGISKEMAVNENVLQWDAVWGRFQNWIQKEAPNDKIVLVAHNGKSFDFSILLRKCKETFNEEWFFLDTLILARHLASKRHLMGKLNLESLRQSFNVSTYGAVHQADADIVVLGGVLKHLLQLTRRTLGLTVEEVVDSGGTNWCCSYATLTQGTSSSKTVSQSPAKEKPPPPMPPPPPVKVVQTSQKTAYDQARLAEQSGYLYQDLKALNLFNPRILKKLQAAGFSNLLSILQHLPRSYISFKDPSTLEHSAEEMLMFRGRITKANAPYSRGMNYVDWELTVDCDAYPLRVCSTQLWGTSTRGGFAARAIAQRFPVDTEAIIIGKMKNYSPYSRKCEITMSQILHAGDWHGCSLVPVYPQKLKIKPEEFMGIMATALKAVQNLQDLEIYPDCVTEKHNVRNWFRALCSLHRPASADGLTNVLQIVKFHDLMCLQLLLLCKAKQRAVTDRALTVTDTKMLDVLEAVFPFSLTEDQIGCINDILEDLREQTPMLRILQGDVGTGKTIVAFMIMFATYGSRLQSTLLVPTEILGQQHYQNLYSLIQQCPATHQPRIALLTSSTKQSERRMILAQLLSGEIDMLIGTHALFNKEVRFHKLGLVVVDEQHKFGVEQRQQIKAVNGFTPHVLMMSATPIPRSMALALYGTLSVSTIMHPLPGKEEVKTYIVRDTNTDLINTMFKTVVDEIASGGRVYIVFPVIEQSENEAFAHLKAVEQEYEILKNTHFRDFSCGLVHGRMSSQEKTEAFTKFANGETHVLMATTVIEVGMDVQEASVMIVYHSERFGLAQLHQLRGRVGRGDRSSYCFLISSGDFPRLNVLQESSDGRTIAMADLKHRGPGDLLGSQQSGYKTFMTLPPEELLSDMRLIDQAREAAEDVFQSSNGNLPALLSSHMQQQGFPSVDDFDI